MDQWIRKYMTIIDRQNQKIIYLQSTKIFLSYSTHIKTLDIKIKFYT